MQKFRRVIRIGLFFCLGLLLALRLSGCSVANISFANSPFPAVAPQSPPQLPEWIEQISPTGQAATTAQIRIRFKEPLIPVESLETPNQQELLGKFEVLPPLVGKFRFLTPRMVGFQADEATPKATRVQVTLKAGLADLKNHRLDKDLVWTFNTEPIKLTNLPGILEDKSNQEETPEPIELKPVLQFTSNLELELESLQEHLKLLPEAKQNSVPLKVVLGKNKEQPETPSEEEKFDPSSRTWTYVVEPQQALSKGTRYRFEVTPGVRPAKGNLPSETQFASRLETYAPLAFQKLTYFGQPDAGGAYGRFEQGAAQLEFNNGLEAEAAIASVSISPAPKKGLPLVQAYEGDRIVNLNPWALEPNTSYVITIGTGLKDKFGQTLAKSVTVKYNTGDVAADIWVPSGLNIFPTGKNLQLNLSTVNLSSYKSAFAVVQPTDLVYTDSAYPKESGGGLLPGPAVWKGNKVEGKKNQPTDTAIPLQSILGGPTGMVAYGIESRTNSYQEDNRQQWREPTFYGLVQLTNLGVFAQWFPSSGIVRVHHLSDGAAVENAAVQVYQSKLEAKWKSTPTPCATGKTDKTGTLLLDRAGVQSCMTGVTDSPQLLVVAQEEKDWAFTRIYEYSGAYGYGISAGWQGIKPVSRGTIFSDRKIYQPGEKVWLTGAAYYLQDGVLKQDKQASYALTIKDPNGQVTELSPKTTNEFGTFSLELPIAKTQPLGYYTIRGKSENGVEITGEFRVAEFKPPNFKVALTLQGTTETPSQPIALGEQTLEATVQSNYLFGSPVEGGKANYYVTRRQAEFTPKGWEAFSFGRKWFWPEEAPSVSSDVLQTSQVLNAGGQSSQKVTVDKDLPYPMTYRVDAQVADVSNLTVSASQQFLALPSDRLIGLQSNFVAEAGKAFPVKVIVTDSTGKPVSNLKVRLDLQQMNYSRVAKLVEGSRIQQNQVEYKSVATADVQSDDKPQTVSLTPPTSGSYRIRATFADASKAVSATDTQIWATGGSLANWGRRYRNNRLDIKLDKKTYRPGEIATALIQSPYPEGELYFAVVRHNTLYRRIVKVQGSAPRIQFQVTPEMIPNAAVEAVLVRQGKPLAQVEPGSLDNLVGIGFEPFKTNLDQQYLKVDTVVKPSLQPGAEQTVQLTLRNAQDQPVKGQLTVMVVNEAILQLSNYRLPDLVKTVYAEQEISTRLSDNRPDVVLQPQASPLEKGWGFGGGLSLGAGNTRIRTDFRALAYYNASVLTDDAGKATVTFKLPDNLTTWRVMTIATDGDLHFGNGDGTFMTTKPLIANPLLPQFARSGDRFQLGVSVTNNTGQTGTVSVQGAVSTPLQLDNNAGNGQGQIETATRAFRFPVVAQATGESKVRFAAQLNNATDAFEVPLEIKPLEVTEQVIETGKTNNQLKIPLNVDKNVSNEVGGLNLSLASTLVPTLSAPAEKVLDETDLPFLEPAASQLAIAANLQNLGQTYGQAFANFNPKQQAIQAIERLQKLQKPDGGFSSYPGQEQSDPFVTPYAAESLGLAFRTFGGDLPNVGSLRSDLIAYLRKLLADPGQYDFCKEQGCKNQVRLNTLIALVELGERRNDFLANLYEQREQLDAVSQFKFVRILSQVPGWQPEADSLSAKLRETVYQTGRSAGVNLPADQRWLNSPTATQSEALRLFTAQKSPSEMLDRLVEGLLALRRNGTWPSTYDNSVALTALVEYSRLQPTPPNFTATVQLAGKTLGTATFEGYRNPSAQVGIKMADLPRDRQDLILSKSGPGTLYYLLAYRYRLQGNQPGRLNGLRITRTIRPANQDKVLFQTGLYAPNPLTVPVGQVYDVGLEVITDHAVDHVVMTDPLPAGFEAVDNSFQTSTPYFQAQGDSWQLNYQTIYRDRVVSFGDRLQPGVYTMHYLVRSVTPGTFLYPGAEVHLQYAPEEFGRSASSTLIVSEK